MFSMAYSILEFPFRQVRLIHSDKRSLSGRLLASFDALYLRVLFGLVVMVQVVRHHFSR
jgi:hypothetical protein